MLVLCGALVALVLFIDEEIERRRIARGIFDFKRDRGDRR